MSDFYEQVGDGVIAIDTEYLRPRMDASHLIVDEGHAAFVDTGTSFSVPNLLAALAAQDLEVEAVDFIILTHIHLDHAGGAGRLAAALPRARVLVHPRGVQHIIDPSILVAATQAVYGEERFFSEYGEIEGIPASRVDVLEEGRRIELGRRTLEIIHTPGHATHHVCILDRDAREAFTGDTFGVSYRELDTAAGEFIFAATTPSQFDPEQMHASIDRILEFRPKTAYLTHYSRVRHLEKLSVDLHADIDALVGIARSVAGAPNRVNAPNRVKRMEAMLFEHLSARLERHGFTGDAAQRHAVLDGDIALNARGAACMAVAASGVTTAPYAGLARHAATGHCVSTARGVSRTSPASMANCANPVPRVTAAHRPSRACCLSACARFAVSAAVLLSVACASSNTSQGGHASGTAAVSGPQPAPDMAADASFDWHGLVVAPFGTLLKESPIALHEVLLFHDEARSAADLDNKDCYATDAPPPRFVGQTPDHYVLCFDHDRLNRIETSVGLPAADAPQAFARACNLWLKKTAPTSGAGNTCEGRDGGIAFSARLSLMPGETTAPLSMTLSEAAPHEPAHDAVGPSHDE